VRTITATHASRGFSDVLDAVERGDTITITRAGIPVAEIRPVAVRSGRALAAALDELGASLDDAFEADIGAATDLLTSDEGDPWRDA
jgi:prevent-host-death family protein